MQSVAKRVALCLYGGADTHLLPGYKHFRACLLAAYISVIFNNPLSFALGLNITSCISDKAMVGMLYN